MFCLFVCFYFVLSLSKVQHNLSGHPQTFWWVCLRLYLANWMGPNIFVCVCHQQVISTALSLQKRQLNTPVQHCGNGFDKMFPWCCNAVSTLRWTAVASLDIWQPCSSRSGEEKPVVFSIPSCSTTNRCLHITLTDYSVVVLSRPPPLSSSKFPTCHPSRASMTAVWAGAERSTMQGAAFSVPHLSEGWRFTGEPLRIEIVNVVPPHSLPQDVIRPPPYGNLSMEAFPWDAREF